MNHLLKSLFLFLLISCQSREINKGRIIDIGKKLTQSEFNYLDLVTIENGLKEKIKELQKYATDYDFELENAGLIQPFGDGIADCILIIRSDYEEVGSRLKYDDELDKFHIRGWQTLTTSASKGLITTHPTDYPSAVLRSLRSIKERPKPVL